MSERRSRLVPRRGRGEHASGPNLVIRLASVSKDLRARPFDREPRTPRAALIGLDVSGTPLRLKTRSVAPIVAAALAAALLLAVLRVDVIRIRFGLADSLAQELALEEEKRRLTVEMRKLRDPAALSRRAHALGFRRAEQLIDLPRAGAPLPLRPRERFIDPQTIELAGSPRTAASPRASARKDPSRDDPWQAERGARQHAAVALAEAKKRARQ